MFKSQLFVLAQSHVIDRMWQKLPAQDTIGRVEQFLLNVKDSKDSLAIQDLTYAINLAFNSSYNRNRPKDLMIWHRLAGDLYLSHLNMQANTLFHYQQALKQAEKLNDLDQKVGVLLSIAHLYSSLQFFERGYAHAVKADKLCQDPRNATKIPHVSNYLYLIADHYILVGKYEHANNSFRTAIERDRFDNPLTKIYTFNNWGVNNRQLEKYQTAIAIFAKGIAFAEQQGITVWAGIMKGNQGSIYFKMGQLDRAKALLEYDLKISTPIDVDNAARSARSLAEIALKEGKTNHAIQMLNHAEALDPKIAQEPKTIRLWASCYAMTQNWKEAYQRASMADQEQEKRVIQRTEHEKRLLSSLTNFWDQENELQQRANQLALQKAQTRQRSIFVLLFFLLFIGIGGIFFWRIQTSRLRTEDQLRLELKELKKQMEVYQNAAQTQIPNSPILNNAPAQMQGTLELNQKLQHLKLLTEQDWRQFKFLFEQVHPDFMQKISNHPAHFTPAELRLLILSKLDLKSREIAETLGISTDGVKKGKQRLKKKLLSYPEESALIALIS